MFESNVNYDLGKTNLDNILDKAMFESNVNYDLGKTAKTGVFFPMGRPGRVCLRRTRTPSLSKQR